ncbi:MAG TPA: hypothetical protein VF691_22965 [Cytophagaceae bacterium]|jgi:L-arabinokinase
MTKEEFFGKGRVITKASSPGRLDVMGGIADYSGSYLLQMPIKEQTTAYLSWRDDETIRVRSSSATEAGIVDEVTISLKSLGSKDKPDYYASARETLEKQAGGDWAIYIIGCFLVLAKEKGLTQQGADVWIDSNVPFGKGVSSSAAIEVAVMTAINASKNIELGRTELPILAQKVENEVVGAPCGLMDQIASYLGRQDSLLPIVCQPCEVYPLVQVPDGIKFSGIDSGIRHSVGGSSYGNVRVAAFMGYSIIAQELGISKKELLQASESGNWSELPYGGYLANISPSIFETKYRKLIPTIINGKEFIEHYGGTIDRLSTVDADCIYDILACTKHPIYENYRVRTFAMLLQGFSSIVDSEEKMKCLSLLGELMYQSHTSYNECGLGSDGTDKLVEMVREKGLPSGLFGAKITGGGSGGTVCILSYGEDGLINAKNICKEYSQSQNGSIKFFEGSSNGGFYNRAEQVSF